jgi:polysaccharide export outer membrane protein
MLKCHLLASECMKNYFIYIFLTAYLVFIVLSVKGNDTNNQVSSVQDPTATEVSATNVPGLTASNPAHDISTTNSTWILSPNDAISMTVYQEGDLAAKTTIDVNGMVMLPLLGQVNIGGLTLGQANARIQHLYAQDYLVNPQVNLTVEQFAPRQFSVLGEVQRPGSYNFQTNEPMNLLEAIAISGGYTRLGAPSKVSVRRVQNGSIKVYRLDAGKMDLDQKQKPFDILPNDIITVGQRTF